MINSGSADLIAWLQNPVKREVPKGWMTAAQISKATRVSECTIRRRLRAGVADGSVLREVYLVTCPDGVTRPTPHYFIKNAKRS
jgi:predicted ArsR family transcriptional regulator